METKTVAPNVEIVWNPADNSGIVRFIGRKYVVDDEGNIVASEAAGMEERTFAQLEALGFDVAGVMQEFKDAFDAVWAERLAAQQPPEA